MPLYVHLQTSVSLILGVKAPKQPNFVTNENNSFYVLFIYIFTKSLFFLNGNWPMITIYKILNISIGQTIQFIRLRCEGLG